MRRQSRPPMDMLVILPLSQVRKQRRPRALQGDLSLTLISRKRPRVVYHSQGAKSRLSRPSLRPHVQTVTLHRHRMSMAQRTASSKQLPQGWVAKRRSGRIWMKFSTRMPNAMRDLASNITLILSIGGSSAATTGIRARPDDTVNRTRCEEAVIIRTVNLSG